MKKRTAFTLIELLIVVAIIAILAAIAVPNFLEAQARSKISRVKADMRSVATAIESYAVDHNQPPWGHWSMRSEMNNYDTTTYGLWRLTTPVAHITSVPVDPFVVKGTLQQIAVPPNRTFAYESTKPYENMPNGSLKANHWFMQNNGIFWYMSSPGPGRDTVSDVAKTIVGRTDQASALYDPTNGTSSRGYIIRTSGGQMESQPEEPADYASWPYQ